MSQRSINLIMVPNVLHRQKRTTTENPISESLRMFTFWFLIVVSTRDLQERATHIGWWEIILPSTKTVNSKKCLMVKPLSSEREREYIPRVMLFIFNLRAFIFPFMFKVKRKKRTSFGDMSKQTENDKKFNGFLNFVCCSFYIAYALGSIVSWTTRERGIHSTFSLVQ